MKIYKDIRDVTQTIINGCRIQISVENTFSVESKTAKKLHEYFNNRIPVTLCILCNDELHKTRCMVKKISITDIENSVVLVTSKKIKKEYKLTRI